MKMCELIPSRDVRNYMAKQGRKLTDFEKAVLLYHRSGISLEERMRFLEELKNLTEDRELKKQIQERLDYEQKCFDLFFLGKAIANF